MYCFIIFYIFYCFRIYSFYGIINLNNLYLSPMQKNNIKEKYVSLRELGLEGPYAFSYLSKLGNQGLLKTKQIGEDYYARRGDYVEYLESFIKEKDGKVKKGIKEYIFKYWKEQARLKEVLDEHLPANVSEFLTRYEDKGISDYDVEDMLIEDWLKHTAYVKDVINNKEFERTISKKDNKKLKEKAKVLTKKREEGKKTKKTLLERLIIPKVNLEPKGYIASQFTPWNWRTSLASTIVLAFFISAVVGVLMPGLSGGIIARVNGVANPPVEKFREFALKYGYIEDKQTQEDNVKTIWQTKNFRIPSKEELSNFIRNNNWHYNSKGYTKNVYDVYGEQISGQVAGVEESK